MTEQQATVLDAIRQKTAELGYAPSIMEIALRAGLSQTRVRQHLEQLKRLGVIRRDEGTARSVRIIVIQTTH